VAEQSNNFPEGIPTKDELWKAYLNKSMTILLDQAEDEDISTDGLTEDQLRKLLFEIEWDKIQTLPPCY
jgi:hypothetical protein